MPADYHDPFDDAFDAEVDEKTATEFRWAEAQQSRHTTLPAAVLAIAEPEVLAASVYRERAAGLLAAKGRVVANFWMRYVCLVSDAARKVVARMIAVAAPTQKPDEAPVWTTLEITAAEACNPSSFRTRLLQEGDYRFCGTKEDLDILMQHHPKRLQLQALGAYGRAEGSDCAVFVFADGVLAPRQHAHRDFSTAPVVAVGDAKFLVTSDLAGITPAPKVPATETGSAADLAAFVGLLHEYFGPAGQIGLGWAFSGLARSKWLATMRGFPLFLAMGGRGSGKTTLCNCVSAAFGTSNLGLSAGDTTEAGLRRRLAQVHALPVRLDDLRPETERALTARLLAIFDQTAGARAARDSESRTRSLMATANVMLAAETQPHDAAILSRCVAVDVDPSLRPGKPLDHAQLLALAASAGTFLLTSFNPEIERTMIAAADGIGQMLGDVDDRQRRQVWGPTLAGLRTVLELAEYDEREVGRLLKEAVEYAKRQIAAYGGTSWMDVFFTDLAQMLASRELIPAADLLSLNPKAGTLMLNLSALFPKWVKHRQQLNQRTLYQERDLRRDLSSLPWLLDASRRVRVGTKLLRMVVVSLAPGVPESIRELVEALNEAVA